MGEDLVQMNNGIVIVWEALVWFVGWLVGRAFHTRI